MPLAFTLRIELLIVVCEAASGGREGIRTLGLSVANAALSQLSYAPSLTHPRTDYTMRLRTRQRTPPDDEITELH